MNGTLIRTPTFYQNTFQDTQCTAFGGNVLSTIHIKPLYQTEYAYRWTDGKGKRHEVYARDLDDLRAKEKEIDADTNEGIKVEARYVIINEMYDLWVQLKRGIKDNTFENYKYMYNTFVRPSFGKKRIQT